MMNYDTQDAEYDLSYLNKINSSIMFSNRLTDCVQMNFYGF